MNHGNWEFAVLGTREAPLARIAWHVGRRLPAELYPMAEQLGFTNSELATYDLGELSEDLIVDDDEIYLRGALVLPDEKGCPAALFGQPLLKKDRARTESLIKSRTSLGVNR